VTSGTPSSSAPSAANPRSHSELVYALLAAWNDHDLERAVTFYAPDYVGEDVAQLRPQVGPAGRVRVLESYIRAFPDLHFTGEVVIEGDRAVLIWTMSGTHRGTIMHIPPTGQRVEVRGVSVLDIEDGQFKRGLNIWDTAGLLRALRLLPELS
jgi:steroid delta-isomerase-like uncharacterized protein